MKAILAFNGKYHLVKKTMASIACLVFRLALSKTSDLLIIDSASSNPTGFANNLESYITSDLGKYGIGKIYIAIMYVLFSI